MKDYPDFIERIKYSPGAIVLPPGWTLEYTKKGAALKHTKNPNATLRDFLAAEQSADIEDYVRTVLGLPATTSERELERLISSREPDPDCIDKIVQAAECVAMEVKLD